MRLIIIAQPKTASTSLLDALGEITGMSHEQQFLSIKSWPLLSKLVSQANDLIYQVNADFQIRVPRGIKLKEQFPAPQYPTISMFHSDIANFPAQTQLNKNLCADPHKQHFPPTRNNISILANIPKVILLRPPEETVYSYRRVTTLPAYLRRRLNNAEFCDKLKGELTRWQDGWLSASCRDPSIRVISKEDVVNRTADVLRLILSSMKLHDLEVPPNYRLPERRYGRD